MIRTRALVAALLAAALLPSLNCAGPGERGNPKSPPLPGAHPCVGLSLEDCRKNTACEAIPYWGESLVACEVDQRGFATNCPFEGCRLASANCPTLAELTKRCPTPCSYNDFGIDAKTGCRTCDCRHP